MQNLLHKWGRVKYKKVEAHALFSALVISLIISFMIGLLLLLHYYNTENWVKYSNDEKLNRNVQSAINSVLVDPVIPRQSDTEKTDLFDNGDDSVAIGREPWGVFDLAVVEAYTERKSLRKTFLYGSELSDTLLACIYLADHQRPLQLSGQTFLSGRAYVPGGIIKTTELEGIGYSGKGLTSGDIHKSSPRLTNFDQTIVDRGSALLSLIPSTGIPHLEQLPQGDSIHNSFSNPIVYYFIPRRYNLKNKNISGKVVLISDTLLEIGRDVQLEDVIVIAPEIQIADDFTGSVQLIASKSIRVGKQAKLQYPSSVVMIKVTEGEVQGSIKISDSASIAGIVLAYATDRDKLKNLVELSFGSTVTGIVYVKGYVEPKGVIQGTVFTDFFQYKGITATFENTLVNAVIDRNGLSPYFVGPIVSTTAQRNIIKWLN